MTKEDLSGWLTFLLAEAGRLSFDDSEAEDLVSETVRRIFRRLATRDWRLQYRR